MKPTDVKREAVISRRIEASIRLYEAGDVEASRRQWARARRQILRRSPAAREAIEARRRRAAFGTISRGAK